MVNLWKTPEPLKQGRFIYFSDGSSKSVRIPQKRPWISAIIVPLLLIANITFAVLHWSSPNELKPNVPPFVFIVLGLFLALYAARIVWAWFGHTTITVGRGALTIGHHSTLGFSHFNHYPLDEVTDMFFLRGKRLHPCIRFYQGHGWHSLLEGDNLTKIEGQELLIALNIAAAPHDLTRKTKN